MQASVVYHEVMRRDCMSVAGLSIMVMCIFEYNVATCACMQS